MAGSVGLVEERRVSARTGAVGVHGINQARIRPGHEASLIDISTHGARIETALRLMPGRQIEMHFERQNQVTAVRARVLRCHVVTVLASRVFYCGAVGFDQPLTWLVINHRDE
jgi:PilZ domain-containing protein